MPIKITRAIIDAIHDGSLEQAGYEEDPIFRFKVPKSCNGIDSKILWPKNTWEDKSAYDATAQKLAKLFHENFKQYKGKSGAEIIVAGPMV